MIAYVLDASVAAKWVLPGRDEPVAVEAIGILDRFTAGKIRLSVPDLFWPEVGNILWKSVRLGRIPEKSVGEAVDWFQDLKLPTSSTTLLIPDALRIAIRFECTVYDSVYLALALSSGRPFLTADERLVRCVGAHLPIRWLGSVV